MSFQGFFFSEDFHPTPGGFGLSPLSSAAAPPLIADPGGVGFPDEVRRTVEGFNSCTESLGCESSDDRSIDGDLVTETEMAGSETMGPPLRARSAEKRRVEFPPPLTSMNKYGQRSFALRPVRRDGRLRLTEVRIRRPEILFACRENGRLTLRFAGDADEEEEDERDEVTGDDLAVEGEEELKEGGGRWSSPASGGEEGEALRRCQEYEAARHRHLRVLSPRCVTTR